MTHVPHKIHFHDHERLRDEWRRRHLDPEAILRQAGLREGMTFADVGAGIGYFTIPAAGIVGPGGKVFAIDTSPLMLCELERAMPPGMTRWIESVHSEEYAIGLLDECCQTAMLAFVAHEVGDPARLLAEAARLLAPRGRLVLLEWDPAESPPPGPPVEARLAGSAIREALVGAGFERIEESRPAPGVYQMLAAKEG